MQPESNTALASRGRAGGFSFFRQTLREWRRASMGWVVALAAVPSMYLSLWPSIRDSGMLATQNKALNPAFAATVGSPDLTTGAGYLQFTIYALIAPALLCIAAITVGSRAIAAPEDAHVMDLMLANPISRRDFVLQRGAALLAVVAALGLVLWIVPLGLTQALNMGVGAVELSAASLGLFLLGTFFAALALAAGAVTGRRGTTVAVASGVAVAGYMIQGISQNVSAMHGWRWISPFYYVWGSDPLHHGFNLGYALVPIVAATVLVMVALFAFDRRDVRV